MGYVPRITLIRGLPGSGKSTLAASIIDPLGHYEADQYFITESGTYKYDPTLLSHAHKYCQTGVECRLQQRKPVVVANTFCELWEMEPYFELAKRYHAVIKVIQVVGDHANTHGVPDETIEKMRSRWEPFESELILYTKEAQS